MCHRSGGGSCNSADPCHHLRVLSLSLYPLSLSILSAAAAFFPHFPTFFSLSGDAKEKDGGEEGGCLWQVIPEEWRRECVAGRGSRFKRLQSTQRWQMCLTTTPTLAAHLIERTRDSSKAFCGLEQVSADLGRRNEGLEKTPLTLIVILNLKSADGEISCLG